MWETDDNGTAAKGVHLEVLPLRLHGHEGCLNLLHAFHVSTYVHLSPCEGHAPHGRLLYSPHLWMRLCRVSRDDLTGPCLYFLH